MRIPLIVLGTVIFLVGCVWILQGINVLPGSFMSGRSIWAVNGAIAAVVGLAVIMVGRRRPRETPR